MSSLRRHEGYLLVDHRNSPGISETDLTPELRAAGFFPTRGRFEAPTLRCCHCGTMVILNPDRTRERHYCARCDHYVCDQAGCVTTCTPFTQTVNDTLEQAAQRLNIKEA